MKTTLKLLTLIFAIGIIAVLSSCEKEEDLVSKPLIDELELGIGDSHLAYIGSDLHIQAEIIAEGTIDKIKVEIHSKESGGDEIEAEFAEFAGLKNTTFHKHVDIPTGTKAGAYHFHLIVTDLVGNQTMIEEDIIIEELVDAEKPVLTISSAPENGEIFANGESISISGTVTDNVSLSGMLVALVYEADNFSNADVTGKNKSVIIMLHTHAFESPSAHNFTASIKVGATNDNNMTPAPIGGDNAWKSGNYYILIKSKDAKGNGVVSDRYPIVVNL